MPGMDRITWRTLLRCASGCHGNPRLMTAAMRQHRIARSYSDSFLSDADPPKQIARGFPQHGYKPLYGAVRPRIGARSNVHRTNILVLKQFADAEHVIGVTDSDATAQSVGMH